MAGATSAETTTSAQRDSGKACPAKNLSKRMAFVSVLSNIVSFRSVKLQNDSAGNGTGGAAPGPVTSAVVLQFHRPKGNYVTQHTNESHPLRKILRGASFTAISLRARRRLRARGAGHPRSHAAHPR